MTSGSAVHYKSMFDAGSQIIAKEGTKSLFKGAAANILRGVAGAGVLSLYDQLQVLMFGKVYSGGMCTFSIMSKPHSHNHSQDLAKHLHSENAQDGCLVPPNSRTNRGGVWSHATMVNLSICCHGRLLRYAFETYWLGFPSPHECILFSFLSILFRRLTHSESFERFVYNGDSISIRFHSNTRGKL